MRQILSLAFLFVICLSVICQSLTIDSAMAAQSIADSSVIGELIVHHYECHQSIFLQKNVVTASLSKNMVFQFSPQLSGHDGHDQVLKLNDDEVTTSSNAQSLVLVWRRSGKALAMAQTMIDNSLTKNYVLIAIDPTDEQSQAYVSCHAVTFSDRAAQMKAPTLQGPK